MRCHHTHHREWSATADRSGVFTCALTASGASAVARAFDLADPPHAAAGSGSSAPPTSQSGRAAQGRRGGGLGNHTHKLGNQPR